MLESPTITPTLIAGLVATGRNRFREPSKALVELPKPLNISFDSTASAGSAVLGFGKGVIGARRRKLNLFDAGEGMSRRITSTASSSELESDATLLRRDSTMLRSGDFMPCAVLEDLYSCIVMNCVTTERCGMLCCLILWPEVTQMLRSVNNDEGEIKM